MQKLLLLLSLLYSVAILAQNIPSSGVPSLSTNSTNSTNSTAGAGFRSATRAVVIGISDYQDPDIPDLRFADKDAEAFAAYLRSPGGGALDEDHLKILLNHSATAGRIAEALDWLIEQSEEGDQAIIYFSGHGDVERKTVTQPGFLLCWDAPARVYMGGGTYALGYLQEIVSTLSVQNKARVTIITDACHAGKLAGSQIGGAQLTTTNLARQFANEIKILSCQSNEYSLEGEQWGGGRGCFSYHLVDGLYGLADRNSDGNVTVGEIDRYLEDHVTPEVAPQSQVPMLLGSKTDRLAIVNAAALAELQKSKAARMAVFTATEGRGFEDEVLAAADSSLKKRYRAFKLAVQEKRFFPVPAQEGNTVGDCAETLYTALSQAEVLAPLRGMMKRNYAAALQDDAQQAMNIWLKADVQQLECVGKSLRLDPIPRQLGRAMELLGTAHYMYRALQARKLLFEGIVLQKSMSPNPDESLGRKCLSVFRQSSALEPNSPLPWHRMCLTYAVQLRLPDSAFVCAQQAQNLAPSWVLPFVDLGYSLSEQNKMESAKQAFQAAERIDSLHPYVLNRWAFWHSIQNDQTEKEKALALFEQYRQSGGPTYPCWYNDYATAFYKLGRMQEAEAGYLKAIELDSTNPSLLDNLGAVYSVTGRYPEAERTLKKAIALDSAYTVAWGNLGRLYTNMGRYPEAEAVIKKAIALDSTHSVNWYRLGRLYTGMGRSAEAEQVFKKSFALDSSFTYPLLDLGLLYTNTQRYEEGVSMYKKALSLDSTFTPAWNQFGYLYLTAGRYAEAEAVFNKAIALDSTYANPRKHLGMVCFKTGRPAEARQHFLQALKLNPNYAPALLGLAYLSAEALAKTNASSGNPALTEGLQYVEQAIVKGSSFRQLQQDEDLAPLRTQPEWKPLMDKYFPDQHKE